MQSRPDRRFCQNSLTLRACGYCPARPMMAISALYFPSLLLSGFANNVTAGSSASEMVSGACGKMRRVSSGAP